jgi:hypothetical protein
VTIANHRSLSCVRRGIRPSTGITWLAKAAPGDVACFQRSNISLDWKTISARASKVENQYAAIAPADRGTWCGARPCYDPRQEKPPRNAKAVTGDGKRRISSFTKSPVTLTDLLCVDVTRFALYRRSSPNVIRREHLTPNRRRKLTPAARAIHQRFQSDVGRCRGSILEADLVPH